MLTLYPTKPRLALVDEIAHHHVLHRGDRYVLDVGRNVTTRAEELLRDGWCREDPRDPEHHLVLTPGAALDWLLRTRPALRLASGCLPCGCPTENVVEVGWHRSGCQRRDQYARFC